jgi:RNA polymerase sigma factor (sigma-70 family)
MNEDTLSREDHSRNLTRTSLLRQLQHPYNTQAWNEGVERLYNNYSDLIYRQARSKGLSPEDAEEVVHDVILCVVALIPGFVYDPAKCKFKTWLYSITRFVTLTRINKKVRGMKLIEHLKAECIGPEMVDPDEQWQRDYEAQLIKLAASKIAARDYQILKYVEEHGNDNAARVLDLSKTAIYSATCRAREQLKVEVERLQKTPY